MWSTGWFPSHSRSSFVSLSLFASVSCLYTFTSSNRLPFISFSLTIFRFLPRNVPFVSESHLSYSLAGYPNGEHTTASTRVQTSSIMHNTVVIDEIYYFCCWGLFNHFQPFSIFVARVYRKLFLNNPCNCTMKHTWENAAFSCGTERGMGIVWKYNPLINNIEARKNTHTR